MHGMVITPACVWVIVLSSTEVRRHVHPHCNCFAVNCPQTTTEAECHAVCTCFVGCMYTHRTVAAACASPPWPHAAPPPCRHACPPPLLPGSVLAPCLGRPRLESLAPKLPLINLIVCQAATREQIPTSINLSVQDQSVSPSLPLMHAIFAHTPPDFDVCGIHSRCTGRHHLRNVRTLTPRPGRGGTRKGVGALPAWVTHISCVQAPGGRPCPISRSKA